MESASEAVVALPKLALRLFHHTIPTYPTHSETPDQAFVRAPPGGDTLVVTVSIGPKTYAQDWPLVPLRARMRPTDEPLDKALTRLAKNLTAKPSKKEKRKKPPGPSADTSLDEGAPGVGAVLYEDPEGTRPLDRTLPNGVAWLRAALLEVAGERFVVEVNPPTVDKLSIDRVAMVGYSTAAAVSLSYSDASACKWRWSAQRPGGSSDGWVDLGCSTQYYTPTAADKGSVLRVECTPAAFRSRRRRCQHHKQQQQEQRQPGDGNDGMAGGPDLEMATAPVSDGAVVGAEDVVDSSEMELWLGETVSCVTGPVQHASQNCSATIRCIHTPTAVQPPGFRILSYNILADQYAGSTYAQNVLFNYCPPECLDPGYRRPLVLRELLGYRADVICLQEVDERAFTDFFTLHLGLQGYSGHYTNKQGRVREGSATFWRTCRFTALAHKDIRLREAFARPLPPLHAQFEPLLAASPELTAALQQVTTIAQATLLAPLEGQGHGATGGGGGGGCLCVVNTHLFFHPYAPHIRTMHTAAILEEVAAFLERCAADPELAGALGPRRPTVLFVGDLNSDLNDGIPGVIELLRRGKLPADYWDWVQGAAFKWGMGEEDAEAMAQGTAQIAAAAAAVAAAKPAAAVEEQATPASPAAVPGNGSAVPHAASPTTAVDTASASASLSSLFAADGHAFDSAAAAPHSPIAVTGIDITSPFVLRSADDLATPYTNYTSGYKALLDYVWYEESALRVVRSVPIPSEGELGSFIPSPAFPSDHLAVVYDMEWR
ncbi:hypothetical protein VOLCADRAFT_88222 [Volvox carteri f. nagariensis]|uniref:Uncharacterized protein n=1 Tax=Volvox carteri f. nagariensis TaxID=3068 RepID=D8TNL7_VOLCA|nr:uncharacterized protein VOLCADRAFT_88222 [Volvox carteri f. nagariensis]EFJ50866.1 hypothetical protein VOLCADRAFT_88222 [Volvox carteri f. nagariensis]|eukprot:XP_002947878.1 hypothetical protein VOLCADRAFT_88222 [Volvox carteri f. nagariensis]